MRSRSLLAFLSILAVGAFAAFTTPVGAEEKKKDDATKDEPTGKDEHAEKTEAEAVPTEPVTCVSLAKSWDKAVKDAKAQNVPIVVHSHGFYCPPCWGMHKSVMCDAAYIEFSFENNVKVLSLDRLREGVTKKEARASTYDAKEGGKAVKYLIELPGLTVDDVLSLRNSKASSYNKSGGLPYTAFIDPFTEEEIESWKGGGIATTEIVDAVKAARETLSKAHGKGKPRPELKAMADAEKASADRVKAGDFCGALAAFAAATKKAEKDGWPTHLRDRITKGRDGAVAAATEALDQIEAGKAEDPVKAKKQLGTLMTRLRGTGLEQRAKGLLAGM